MKRFCLLRCQEQTEVRLAGKQAQRTLTQEYCPSNFKGDVEEHPGGLTVGRVELRTWLRRFYTAPALFVARQLPDGEPRFLSPGNQPGWQSDSPLGAGRPVTSWQPCCSFFAVPSIFHPAQNMQNKRVGKRWERLVTLC